MRRGTAVGPLLLVAALTCVALVAGGCSGDRDTDEGRKIEAAVKRFSMASGPGACAMLTPKALTTVYGRGSLDATTSRARCLAASKRFSGEPVTITFVKITDATTAHATARTAGGRRYFTVGLQKRRGRWRINAVTVAQRPG